ncbi:MAG: hypothetical protein M0P97_03175 [Candidatus Moranbacteria bacterium]|nr:hypothetical protein [Candidatus Moranbacteria bacterium]
MFLRRKKPPLSWQKGIFIYPETALRKSILCGAQPKSAADKTRTSLHFAEKVWKDKIPPAEGRFFTYHS